MFRSARVLVDHFVNDPDDGFRRLILKVLFLFGDFIIVCGWCITSWPSLTPSSSSISGMVLDSPLKFGCTLAFLASLMHWLFSVVLELARWRELLVNRLLLSRLDHCFYDMNTIVMILFGFMAPALLLQDESHFEKAINEAGRLNYMNLSVFLIVMLFALFFNCLSAIHEFHPFLYPILVLLCWVGGSAGFAFKPLSSGRTFLKCGNSLSISSSIINDLGQCLLKGHDHSHTSELIAGLFFTLALLILFFSLFIYLTDPRLKEQRRLFSESKHRNNVWRQCLENIHIFYHFLIAVPYRFFILYIFPWICLSIIILLIPAFLMEDPKIDEDKNSRKRQERLSRQQIQQDQEFNINNGHGVGHGVGNQSFNSQRSEYRNRQLRQSKDLDHGYEYGRDDEHAVGRTSKHHSHRMSSNFPTTFDGEEEREYATFKDWVFSSLLFYYVHTPLTDRKALLSESGLWYPAFYRCLTCSSLYGDISDSDEEAPTPRHYGRGGKHSHSNNNNNNNDDYDDYDDDNEHHQAKRRSTNQSTGTNGSQSRLSRNSKTLHTQNSGQPSNLRVGIGAPRGAKFQSQAPAPPKNRIDRTSLEIQAELDEKAFREDIAKRMAARKSQDDLEAILGSGGPPPVLEAKIVSKGSFNRQRHRSSDALPTSYNNNSRAPIGTSFDHEMVAPRRLSKDNRSSSDQSNHRSSLQQPTNQRSTSDQTHQHSHHHHHQHQQHRSSHRPSHNNNTTSTYHEPLAPHHQPSYRTQHSIEEVDREDDDTTIASSNLDDEYEKAGVAGGGAGDVSQLSAVLSIIHEPNSRIPDKLRRLKSLNLPGDGFEQAKKILLEQARTIRTSIEGDEPPPMSSPRPPPTPPPAPPAPSSSNQRPGNFVRQRSQSVDCAPQYYEHKRPSEEEQQYFQQQQYLQQQQHRPSQQQHRPSQQQHRPSQSEDRSSRSSQYQQSRQRSQSVEITDSNFAKLTQENKQANRRRVSSVGDYDVGAMRGGQFEEDILGEGGDGSRQHAVRLSNREPIQVGIINSLDKQDPVSSRPSAPSLSQALHGNSGAPRPKNWKERGGSRAYL
mmetsp:Transcript_5867/g.7248  ORF Transcript_5867/g.7248 Transcript_5867/m.7248 type:complete len:1062 (-) Transcript_5867:389-3574(-)